MKYSKTGLKLNNSPANPNGDRLGSVGGAEFFHDVLDVYFDGLFRDEEFFGNVTVAVAPGNLLENLDLPASEGLVGEVLG